MTKKEIKLYTIHGRKWNVYIKYKITFSSYDAMNVIKCCETAVDYDAYILKRLTRRIRLFNNFIYFNKLYLGADEND